MLRARAAGPPCAPALVCIPASGGFAARYLPWARQLHSVAELVGLDLPGRGSAQGARANTLPEAVERLAGEVAAFGERPFVLYGHSLGALIAFEITRLLAAAGLPTPKLLVVGAAAAPGLDHWRRGRPETTEDVAAFVGRVDGTPAAVLASRELREIFIAEVAADLALLDTYAPSMDSVPVPIAAAGGLRDQIVTPSQIGAWRESTTGRFDLKMFDGGHFFFDQARTPFFQFLDHCIADVGPGE